MDRMNALSDYPMSDPDEELPHVPLTGNISDDEDSSLPAAAPFSMAVPISAAPPLISSAIGSRTGTPGSTHTPTSNAPSDHDGQLAMKRTASAARLVSYAGDDDDDDDDDDDGDASGEDQPEIVSSDPEKDKEGSGAPQGIVDYEESFSVPDLASSVSRSVQNKMGDEIRVPPAPSTKCSKALQEKISGMYSKLCGNGRRNEDYTAVIMKRKDIRNPSIYEKLIETTGINEKGTNFPQEIFDPGSWGKESFYDELAKAHFAAQVQKMDMERREKEKKERTKVEFISVTKTVSASSSDSEKKRTKWDPQPAPGVPVVTAASGTKSASIPALGSLKKK